MINSIEINNFRNLDGLKIDSLDRVNLITGKNNTGKSTLLEAIALYIAKSDLSILVQLLEERGEIFRRNNTGNDASDEIAQALSSLFTDRVFGFAGENKLKIAVVELSTQPVLNDKMQDSSSFISLKFVKFQDHFSDSTEESLPRRKRLIIEDETDELFLEARLGLEVSSNEQSSIIPLDNGFLTGLIRTRTTKAVLHFQFVRTRNIERELNGKLWDSIALTDEEQYVIDALKIVEPQVERITFVEDRNRSRVPVVKLMGNNTIFPLRTMGDGINRILTIILALVNSKNGFFLLDEFENGLHYTVQYQLWEVIFKLAYQLNIQVFVTTHSEDCISGFEGVLNDDENEFQGKLIRLDNKNGKITQVQYSKELLGIAINGRIETR